MPNFLSTDNDDINETPIDGSVHTNTLGPEENASNAKLDEIAERLKRVEEMLKESTQLSKDNKYQLARLAAEIQAAKNPTSDNEVTPKNTPNNTFWGG